MENAFEDFRLTDQQIYAKVIARLEEIIVEKNQQISMLRWELEREKEMVSWLQSLDVRRVPLCKTI